MSNGEAAARAAKRRGLANCLTGNTMTAKIWYKVFMTTINERYKKYPMPQKKPRGRLSETIYAGRRRNA
jgi:hypothetical protein